MGFFSDGFHPILGYDVPIKPIAILLWTTEDSMGFALPGRAKAMCQCDKAQAEWTWLFCCRGKTWNVWLDALEYHGFMCACINKSLSLSIHTDIWLVYVYYTVCIYIYISTYKYYDIHSTDIHWLIQTKYQLVECTEPDTASFPRSWTWKLRIVSACDLVMPTIIAPLCNAFAGNWVELG